VEHVLPVELGDALPELPILADDGHPEKRNGARLALSREEA
jgi:hypothetical protein